MPKNNKNKPNAFYFFMLDWKKQEESKGRKFPNGLKDVQADWECNKMWKSLSDEDRVYYKEKEKNNKIQRVPDKKTSLGESIAEVTETEIKKENFLENMKQFISSVVKEAKQNSSVQRLKFYVIHINYFYGRIVENNEVEYCPAEIAIAEFSLEEGVTRTFNKIVRPKIKMGYAHEASEHSKNTHQIPKDFELGEEDYDLIHKEICEFLEPGRLRGKLPPLFTRYSVESIKYPVISVLKMLSSFNKNSFEDFTIYSFEELFTNLYNINIQRNTDVFEIDIIIASMKLKDDPFDYKKSIECEFHKEMFGGGNYCSKSFVQRWISVLCLNTCDLFGISLKPGFHIPIEEANIKKSYELFNTFESLSLNVTEPVFSSNTKKAGKNQIKHISERTYADEQRRRVESMAKPMEIIDHSLINATSQNRHNPPDERPLRPPFTRSTVYQKDTNNVNLDEDNFPSLGRGSGSRGRGRDRRKQITPKGIDYASRLK